MAPDLPDKLLGIDIDGDDRTQQRADEENEEEHVRLVYFAVGDHRLAVPVDDVRTTTDVPDELTPVPRTPPAVDGVTDLRGEITAVIDPSVHFPTDGSGTRSEVETTAETPAEREQLLVFDRGSDDQSAAVRVDDVLQVVSVPERDILEADDVETREFSTTALEHPLVSALAERERTPTRRIGETLVSPAADEGTSIDASPAADDATPTGGSNDAASAGRPDSTATEEEAGTTAARGEPSQERPVVVELTPLVDVDKLLLVSGPRS